MPGVGGGGATKVVYTMLLIVVEIGVTLAIYGNNSSCCSYFQGCRSGLETRGQHIFQIQVQVL
jgi:hypothetical protein